MNNTPATAEKPSYAAMVTARFADGESKAGKTLKNVVNLFWHGGKDSRGMPVLSGDKVMAVINKTGAKLSIHATDKEGKPVLDEAGKMAKPLFQVGLDRFTKGMKSGLAAAGLEVGQGTITGQEAGKLAKSFNAVLEAKVSGPSM